MANNAFDRTTLGLRERPVSADFNRNMSQRDRSLRDTLQYMLSARSLSSPAGVPYSGFIGDGFRIVPTSPIGLSVQLTPGLGFFYATGDLPVDLGATDLEGVDDRSTFKPMLLTAPQQFAVPTAPSAGNSRIDIIEARYDRRLEDGQTRRQLDETSKTFSDHLFFKTLAWALDGRVGTVNSPSPSTAALSYKVGAVAATGSQIEPAVTTGYVQLARVNVGPTVTTLDTNVLTDRRPLLYPGGIIPFGGTWRLQWNGGAPIVTALAITAPPGIGIALQPVTAARGEANLWVIGGQITQGTAMIQASYPTAAASDRFPLSLTFPNGTGSQVTTVSSFIQTDFATAVPAIMAGIGASVFEYQLFSRFITNTGTSNNTDTTLEDAIVQVNGTLSYT